MQRVRGKLAAHGEVGETQVAGDRRVPQVHARDDAGRHQDGQRDEAPGSPQAASGAGGGAARSCEAGPL